MELDKARVFLKVDGLYNAKLITKFSGRKNTIILEPHQVIGMLNAIAMYAVSQSGAGDGGDDEKNWM